MSKSMVPVEQMYSIPKGFRFCPTDQELLLYYLRGKILSEDLPINIIHEVDLYKHGHPESLTENFSPLGEGDNKWYFFTKLNQNGSKADRMTGKNEGRWKITGAKTVVDDGGNAIGMRRALCYWKRSSSKEFEKTNWIMHQYSMQKETQTSADKVNESDLWVLCRIYCNSTKKEDPSSSDAPLCMNGSSTGDSTIEDLSNHVSVAEAQDLSPPIHHLPTLEHPLNANSIGWNSPASAQPINNAGINIGGSYFDCALEKTYVGYQPSGTSEGSTYDNCTGYCLAPHLVAPPHPPSMNHPGINTSHGNSNNGDDIGAFVFDRLATTNVGHPHPTTAPMNSSFTQDFTTSEEPLNNMYDPIFDSEPDNFTNGYEMNGSQIQQQLGGIHALPTSGAITGVSFSLEPNNTMSGSLSEPNCLCDDDGHDHDDSTFTIRRGHDYPYAIRRYSPYITGQGRNVQRRVSSDLSSLSFYHFPAT